MIFRDSQYLFRDLIRLNFPTHFPTGGLCHPPAQFTPGLNPVLTCLPYRYTKTEMFFNNYRNILNLTGLVRNEKTVC